MMWYGWHGGWGWGGWLAMAIVMLAFWAVIVAALVVVVRSLTQRRDQLPPAPPGSSDDAVRILDERFARGEIDAEEYRSRRELLRSR